MKPGHRHLPVVTLCHLLSCAICGPSAIHSGVGAMAVGAKDLKKVLLFADKARPQGTRMAVMAVVFPCPSPAGRRLSDPDCHRRPLPPHQPPTCQRLQAVIPDGRRGCLPVAASRNGRRPPRAGFFVGCSGGLAVVSPAVCAALLEADDGRPPLLAPRPLPSCPQPSSRF